MPKCDFNKVAGTPLGGCFYTCVITFHYQSCWLYFLLKFHDLVFDRCLLMFFLDECLLDAFFHDE